MATFSITFKGIKVISNCLCLLSEFWTKRVNYHLELLEFTRSFCSHLFCSNKFELCVYVGELGSVMQYHW